MSEPVIKVVKTYKAVILAGGIGNRMFPLTNGQSKSLLPVANCPLICYQLQMLENAGFEEVYIITKPEYMASINHFLENDYRNQFKGPLAWKLVATDVAGTADALRATMKDLDIKTNFLVVSGDIITTASINTLVAQHYQHNATLTAMYKRPSSTDLAKEVSKKDNEEDMSTQTLAYDEQTNRLVYVRMRYSEQSPVMNKSVMRSFPKVRFVTNLHNAHLYLMSPSIFTLLEEQPHISSIQADLLPYLTSCQFIPSSQSWAPEVSQVAQRVAATSHTTSPVDFRTKVSCYIHFAPDDVFLERCNTIPSYIALNRRMAEGDAGFHSAYNHIEQAKLTCSRAAINGCTVGADLKLEPSTINNSIIGHHCKIGKGCKITNCIIMDYVNINEYSTLTDTIICSNATIGAKSVIKKCRVAHQTNVEEESSHENETVQSVDGGDYGDEEDDM